MSEPSPPGADTTGMLHRGVDLWAVISLGLGTAVGVAIFSVIAPATALAGPGMLLAVLIAAVPMFVIAVTYAFMGSALPTSGASFEWSRRFVSPFAGFMIAWLRIVSNLGAILVLALVLIRYLNMVVPIPTKPAMFVVFVIFWAVNMIGVGLAGRLQVLMIAAMVGLFAVFAAWGAPSITPQAYEPLLPQGWAGVFAAIPLLIGLFFGLESSTEIGDEVKDARRVIPLGLALSILAAVALYLMVAGVTVGVLGASALGTSDTPLLDAAEVFMGPLAKPLIVTAAVVAIGTSINSLFLGFSRNLFAMARAGMLPKALMKVHPRTGAPYVALSVILVGATLGLAAPMNLTALFLAVNIPTLLKYAGVSLSAAVVARQHPEIYEAATFRLSKRATVFWAYAGAVMALIVALLGLSADWTPYAALAVWAALGTGYYLAFLRKREAG
ncbi:APC family permease [Phenylobacterium sp.]|uniref:APC family permease n=1 Tax=Phenylobacterium sp. TaxID=1871053 RepID=UPI002730F3CC|nr:amino acid permease [Phenylobacterium sp.]MDP1875877.1 amino acid permease [Phenylobacterium sp.]